MSKRSRGTEAPAYLAGILLVFAGAYLFVALVSYDPRSVPGWAPLISSVASSSAQVTQNLGGPLGALIAGYSLFFIGGASYLLAVVILGYGLAKWFLVDYKLRDKMGWGVLMVLLGACLLQIQPIFLQSWEKSLRIEGPGGFFGLWIGENAIYKALGPASVFLILGVYVMSLMFTITSHPIKDSRLAWKAFLKWREARHKASVQRMNEEQRVATERRALEKKAGKLEKQLKQKGIEIPVEEQPELLVSPAEPEIIDSTAPSPKKPKLSELRAGREVKDTFTPGFASVHLENYIMPSPDLLDEQDETDREPLDREELKNIQTLIIETLAQFGIKATPGTITKGPTITRYEVYPDVGVRVDKIVALERDIARATRAERISLARARRLHAAIRTVLARAVQIGGSTLKDFSNAQGESGYFQLEAAVYAREGLACRVCNTAIKAIRQGQRSTFYCPVCQKP